MEKILFATVGAVAGAIAGYILGRYLEQKKSLETITNSVDKANEELKEMYERKYKDAANESSKQSTHVDPRETEKSEENSNNTEPVVATFINYGSAQATTDYDMETDGKTIAEESIRVISPTEIGLEQTYDIVSVNVYSNGIVMDDLDRPVELLEDHIGDAMDHVGEYCPNTVYVVNDDEDIYYEIIVMNEPYEE